MRGSVLIICLLATIVCGKHLKPEDEQEENDVQGGYDNVVEDPCSQKRCGPGHECDLDDGGHAICVCARVCTPEVEERAKVCSTQNVTFDSECEFHRQKCLCQKKQAGCLVRKYRKAHLDYYGPCKEIARCERWELEEYPERMRQWLYYVMEELADRRDLPQRLVKIAEDAKTHPKKWVIPVIWKFCNLDISMDRMIDDSELLPITAPLKPLEHCTGPFLRRCDTDNDGNISLAEWGTCLGLDPEEIEDRCDELRE